MVVYVTACTSFLSFPQLGQEPITVKTEAIRNMLGLYEVLFEISFVSHVI